MELTLTEEIANQIYDILVADCRAAESMRDSWIYHQTKADDFTHEWRFSGNLGFGGKFWRGWDAWYVDAYSEDYTQEREKIIAATNKKLTALREEFRVSSGQE
ncbi:MAG: hypothetical protein V3S30_08145 [Thermoanaerobaculia bacterium]